MQLDNTFIDLLQREGTSHPPDQRGRFGIYGGRFVPETLMSAVLDLEEQFVEAWADRTFLQDWITLLQDYVGRPSPVYLARRLSKETGVNVWLKREDLNHTGAHKINNTLGQALLAQRLGKSKLIAETGAGQHGLATATAAALLGLECQVYMGEEDVRRQALNVHKMRMLGAGVVPVSSGTCTLKDATNEALRTWVATVEDTHYIIGSAVGPHPYPWMVRAFQSVIGFEARHQLAGRGIEPDIVLACVGGGSNAMGTFHAFRDTGSRLLAVEAGGRSFSPGEHGASLAHGQTGVLHGSVAKLLQTETGQIQPAHSISAGLDYPGVGPELAFLKDSGRLEVLAVTDTEAQAAFFQLTKLEGILPALESSHAIAALSKIKHSGEETNILLTLSGRGDKDVDQILEMEGR